jgi:hypothetical protein
LLQCGYNSEEALRRRRMNAVPPADTMSLWWGCIKTTDLNWGPFLTSLLAPRGELHPKGLTSPLGVYLAPRVVILPLGVMFTPSFTPRGEHYCLDEWRGEKRISPRGDNLTTRGQNSPWDTVSPLGSNFVSIFFGGGGLMNALSKLAQQKCAERFFSSPRRSLPGLPDFSWSKIPKRGKLY